MRPSLSSNQLAQFECRAFNPAFVIVERWVKASEIGLCDGWIHLEALRCFWNAIVTLGATLLNHFSRNFSAVKPVKFWVGNSLGKIPEEIEVTG